MGETGGLGRLWGEPSALPREESNPFSFKEFVRSKSRNPEPGACTEPGGGNAQGFSRHEDEEEEEEEEAAWSSSSSTYRPSAVEEALLPLRTSAPGPPCGPVDTYHQLKEENSQLRSRIRHVQAASEAQAERIKQLEKALEENKRKEAKEARDLDAMVQQVEENLRRMTKRASKAESSVAKLKQENALLQVQAENYLANLAAVKRNADAALHNLLMVLTKSRLSVKQLLSGAEELQIVAEILKSMDKISEIPSDSPEIPK